MEIKPLLAYNPNIDEKTAMQEALKVWAWLKETGLRKGDHPEHDIFVNYDLRCPLCEVFISRRDTCEQCPLCTNNNPCYEDKQPYRDWENVINRNINASKEAEDVYSIIHSTYKQRYSEEFNPYVEPES